MVETTLIYAKKSAATFTRQFFKTGSEIHKIYTDCVAKGSDNFRDINKFLKSQAKLRNEPILHLKDQTKQIKRSTHNTSAVTSFSLRFSQPTSYNIFDHIDDEPPSDISSDDQLISEI